ncbi:DNA-primase RepB domain-containing protein [Accumulibacter sp.]|uniref:DNA-primase RepB domain-containing protein n=1 Tax=Accumulibacter sp. TaxID=2053492 RepID=UPI0025E78FE3|nr:DNA-primase RepB domain-containing protein [Accumulibacter sp.]MCM8596895.1 RepB family DNA primase [Accumulibacter sp.]MCM8624394.1 RepB family DNA primase [Accumulibacter sp.]MDS4051043.1 DNA-primase RepB domain-containing protein [Accumulibacter sp.]
MTPKVLTDSATEPVGAGKGGEGGDFQVSNADFVAAVFPVLPEGAFAAACSKRGDPGVGGWPARRADQVAATLSAANNNYIACASFYPGDDGSFRARKAQFAACHFLMLDDLGTKVPLERLAGFQLSWLIETSPGNHQGGILLAEPLTDGSAAVRLLNAVIDSGLCDAGATGPLSRWARLPVAINGKPKYASDDGAPFQCRLLEWRPDARYTPQEIVERLQLELAPAGRPKKSARPSARVAQVGNISCSIGNDADDVFTPKAAENPVVAALKVRGLYKTPLGSGKHDVTCPWAQEHTDALDTGAAYFEPDELYPLGGFCCQHSHRDQYRVRALLEFLGVRSSEARHKPVIRVVAGDLHRVVDAAEKELADRGRHYQAGGLIVSISTDPTSGDPSIVPTSGPALTRELSVAASWEKFDRRAGDWVRCDPPARHVAVLFDAQTFRYLPPLAGVARQPYFRESDGELITQAGYEKSAQRFGVFDARQFVVPEPTQEAARAALRLLEDLLTEFHFVADSDKAAALSAIFTAVVRPALPHAPAFHVRAPVAGSGKTYLCELIGAFAGPGGNAKVSYPMTSEEATKVILSLLLTSPAVIEFDDMDTDWLPHGTIKRMLTAEQITDRILGVSKTATVSTRTLFLGSGNNVGPIRDLLRRVLTIHIDPRCATPATITYQGCPVEKVRQRRGVYVAAVLTIIQAWRTAGMPRAAADSIVTFGGAWSDYCRYPLMWLGQPDPATALLKQVRHDPDGDALRALMTEWHAAFGPTPTTVRKAVDSALFNRPNLLDAIREFPVEERGEINRSKLGWVLKKHANRIVGGLEFQQAEADGRTAWRVAVVKSPPLPPLPPLTPPLEKSVTPTEREVGVEI